LGERKNDVPSKEGAAHVTKKSDGSLDWNWSKIWVGIRSGVEFCALLAGSAVLYETHEQSKIATGALQEARRQNEAVQRQIQLQEEQDYATRRAELYTTLYDRRESCDGVERDQRGRCPIKASPKAREEAVKALVRLERNVVKCTHSCPGTQNVPNVEAEWLGPPAKEDGWICFHACSRAERIAHARIGLAELDMRDTDLTDVDFQHAVLDRALFNGARLVGANFRAAELRWAQFDRADLSDARFDGAAMIGAQLHGVRASDTSFNNAIMCFARFSEPYADKLTLLAATFYSTTLVGAEFGKSIVFGSFEAADLRGAFLGGASFTGSFHGALYSAETQFPKGFALRAGMIDAARYRVSGVTDCDDVPRTCDKGAHPDDERLLNECFPWPELLPATVLHGLQPGPGDLVP
jgi:Pentapeptide repeats (9 copies)